MKHIQNYVHDMRDSIEKSKCYIEKALMYKAEGNTSRYAKYKEMSSQLLTQAEALHTFAVEDINKLKAVYPEVPTEMMDRWTHAHNEFIEKVAWIKQMIAM